MMSDLLSLISNAIIHPILEGTRALNIVHIVTGVAHIVLA